MNNRRKTDNRPAANGQHRPELPRFVFMRTKDAEIGGCVFAMLVVSTIQDPGRGHSDEVAALVRNLRDAGIDYSCSDDDLAAEEILSAIQTMVSQYATADVRIDEDGDMIVTWIRWSVYLALFEPDETRPMQQ